MIIYQVEYNDACKCHPEMVTEGYYATLELAEAAQNTVWEREQCIAQVNEIEVQE